MNIEEVLEQVKKEYGDDGFVPNLYSDVCRTLREAFSRCAALCEKGGDETVSYGEFVKLRNQVGAVLPKEGDSK